MDQAKKIQDRRSQKDCRPQKTEQDQKIPKSSEKKEGKVCWEKIWSQSLEIGAVCKGAWSEIWTEINR